MHQPTTTSKSPRPAPETARKELAQRLDDLRGLGILSGSSEVSLRDENALIELGLSLVDALETTQRRLIETSIQVISLRELVAKLLSLRTPEEVAETVTLYLHKAFDHERVLVGVYEPGSQALEGWFCARNEGEMCRPFHLQGDWGGAVRRVIEDGNPISANGSGPSFLEGSPLPDELQPFHPDSLGSYLVYPLSGRGQHGHKVHGVLMVGRSPGGAPINDMEAGILESVVEAVGTAMENVILEEDVRREEAFRKDIMRSMASGLVAVGLDGQVLAMNARAEELTGWTLAELRGETTACLGVSGGGVGELLTKTLESRKPIRRVERAVRRHSGGAFPATCATMLLRNPAGEVYGAVATFDDLTEIKEMEERIRSLDRLAALGRFTAGIAHEIRNPLTGISTGVQYLQRQLKDAGDHGENLGFIQREIERLDGIIEDLFRVTHPSPLRKTPENAEKLIHHAIRSLGSLPAERGVEITTSFQDGLPPLPVDPDQIQQVVINLIKNAVEACPEGGEIKVHAYASPDEVRPVMALQFMDSGPGIDETSLPHIFEPFFTKGKPEGTGLGLYVSHGIVERHGGELHAANRDHGGAIFTLKLPLNVYDTTETLS